MRLWPYQLLSVLPGQYLLGQWRECLAVAGMYVQEDGKIKHATVKRVCEYDLDHFVVYCHLVKQEMNKRGYTVGENALMKLDKDVSFLARISQCKVENGDDPKIQRAYVTHGERREPLFEGWQGDRYLKQCLYMFQEKYDVGTLSDEEWTPMESVLRALEERTP